MITVITWWDTLILKIEAGKMEVWIQCSVCWACFKSFDSRFYLRGKEKAHLSIVLRIMSRFFVETDKCETWASPSVNLTQMYQFITSQVSHTSHVDSPSFFFCKGYGIVSWRKESTIYFEVLARGWVSWENLALVLTSISWTYQLLRGQIMVKAK